MLSTPPLSFRPTPPPPSTPDSLESVSKVRNVDFAALLEALVQLPALLEELERAGSRGQRADQVLGGGAVVGIGEVERGLGLEQLALALGGREARLVQPALEILQPLRVGGEVERSAISHGGADGEVDRCAVLRFRVLHDRLAASASLPAEQRSRAAGALAVEAQGVGRFAGAVVDLAPDGRLQGRFSVRRGGPAPASVLTLSSGPPLKYSTSGSGSGGRPIPRSWQAPHPSPAYLPNSPIRLS